MWAYVLPVLFCLFIWWFSTGLILYLDGLPARTFKWTFLGASVVLVLAFVGLATSRDLTTVAGAYCAFTCAVLIWGWQEVAFLLGYVTGPRKTECPPLAKGWRRAGHAFMAVAHHEAALVVLAAGVWFTLGDSPNQTGWWTYLVLWVMRQSAKLNVFLGVRNLNEEFLPPHLKYLQTYFTQRPMNLLFPFSVTLSTVAAVWLWQAVGQADMSTHEAAALVFAATMLSLAVLEHWLLVVPMPSQALWSWGFASREKDRNESPPAKLRSGAVAHSSASSLPQ